jgi:hypothetical protein
MNDLRVCELLTDLVASNLVLSSLRRLLEDIFELAHQKKIESQF